MEGELLGAVEEILGLTERLEGEPENQAHRPPCSTYRWGTTRGRAVRVLGKCPFPIDADGRVTPPGRVFATLEIEGDSAGAAQHPGDAEAAAGLLLMEHPSQRNRRLVNQSLRVRELPALLQLFLSHVSTSIREWVE